MRIRAVVLTVSVLAGFVAVGAPPAAAHRETCAGIGALHVNVALTYPVVGVPVSTPFNGNIGGACAEGAGTLSGNIIGACFHATGEVMIDGHASDLLWIGTMLFIGTKYGSAVGSGTMVPALGQSCLFPGADQFQITLTVETV